MTLTIELSEADEALLQKAADQSRKTKEQFARLAVMQLADDRTRADAEKRDEMRAFLAKLRDKSKGIPPLPESAYRRSSFYED